MPSLAIFRRYVWATGILLMVYSIAVTLPHEKVQDWLAIEVVKPLGFTMFYRVMAGLALVGMSVAGAMMARQLPRHEAKALLRNYFLLTLVLVTIAWRFLTVNNSELIHFAQYAITGFILMAVTLGATETLSFVMLLGGIDEAHQYAVIHPDWGNPYDFNDLVLDFLGGSIGVLLCILWLKAIPRRGDSWRWLWKPGTLALATTVTVGALMLLADQALVYKDEHRSDYWFALSRKHQDFWFYDATWGPRTIHAIAPLEGPILLIGLLATYSYLDRRYEFRFRS